MTIVMIARRPLLVFVLLAAFSGGRGSAQELASSSPFLPSAGAVAGVVTENAPLELRGIVGMGDARLFNIFDPSSKQSRWVRLNEPGSAFTVKSHDEATDTVSLDYAGRSLSLRLPEAKITSLAATPVPAVANNRPRRPEGQDAPSPPAELSAEQAKRLENVAAEVTRRRALRNTTQNGDRPPNAR